MTVKSYLGRYQPSQPAGPDDLAAMRRAVWQQQGVAVIPITEIRDDWTRQTIINEANRLYGRRREVAR